MMLLTGLKKKCFIRPISLCIVVAMLLPFNFSNKPVLAEFLSSLTNDRENISTNAVSKESVEVISMRTQNAKHFLNPEGTYTAQISSSPIHYKDKSSQWQDIDTSLLADTSGNSYRNGANSFSINFSKNTKEKDLINVQDGPLTISFSPKDKGSITPVLKDKTITYASIMTESQTDLKYTSLATGIKSEIILKTPPHTNIFKFSLSTVGLTPKLLDNGQIVFYDAAGQPRWYIPASFAYDAKDVRTNEVAYNLTENGDVYDLAITVDQKWLSDPVRKYPVIIDPTLILYASYGTGDTYIDYLNPYNNYEYYQQLDTCSYKRALIKFDISSIPSRNDILNSWITLQRSQYSFCASSAYPMTMDWRSTYANWYYNGLGQYWSGGSYDSSKGTALFGDSYVYANVTNAVRFWYTGDSANYGLLIKPDSENGAGPCYYSTESSYPPTLTVNYAPWNGTQDRWQYVSLPQGDGQETMVNVANGNLVINHQDWNINSPGMNMTIGRTYNSMTDDTVSKLFGQKWTTNIDARIKTVNLAGSTRFVSYRDPTGTWFSFASDGAGGWKRPSGLSASLVWDSTWCVKYDNGITYRFGTYSSSDYYLTSIYDRNGRTITINRDYNNMITSIEDTAGRSTSFSNNGYGSVATITDSTNRTTSYAYTYCYSINNYVLSSFTNQASRQTTYQMDSYGKVTLSTDPKGNQTKYNYDGNGRISSVIYCDGSTDMNTYTFTYDDTNRKTTVTDPLYHSTQYYWEKDGGTIWKTIDAASNQCTSTWGDEYKVLEVVERTGNKTTYHYVGDQNMKLDKITKYTGLSNGIVTTYAYNDSNNPYLPTTTTDPEGNTTTYSYNTSGNLLSTQFMLDNSSYYSYFEYDANKKYQLKNFTDPKGNITNYEYNGTYYELSKVTDPLSKVTTYTYDSLSRMLTEVDAKSQTTSYTYDTLNRVTRIDYQGGAYATYAYDYNGNLTQMYESANGTTSYTYDYRNRVTLKTFPDATTISYVYDGASNLTSKTDAGGTVSYAYNAVNLLYTVTEPGNYVTQYTSYDGSGNLLSMTYPNSVVVTNSWDVANRLTLTQTKLGETTLEKFSYTYYDSTNGRDTSLRQTMTDKNNYTVTYTYDKLNELTSAIKRDSGQNILDSRSWIYNENSNRTQQIINSTTTNYTYDNDNRILTAGTLSYTWDNNGNLVSRSDGLGLTYNTKDFTDSITPPGGSAISMSYSGTDQTQRIQKGSTTYKYDDKAIGPAIQTAGGSSTYFTTTPSGSLVGLRQSTNRYYYIFDGLGSVVGLTNSSGTVVNTYSYDPYGIVLSQTEGVAQPYKFAGVYYDSEIGLYKMGARYYDPNIGRFTQVDPIALPNVVKNGGFPWFIQLCRSGQNAIGALSNAAFCPAECNFFIYAGNDPVNSFDPTGYWNWGKFWKTVEKIHTTIETVCAIGLFVSAVGITLVSVPLVGAIVLGVFLVPAAGAAIYCGVTIIKNVWDEE